MKSGNPLNSMLFPWMEPWTWMKRTDPPSGGGGGDDPPDDPPAVQPSPPTVTIESGDTLSEIAEDHGVTVDDLLDANPDITDADVIYAGDDITIPTTTPSPPPDDPPPPPPDDDYGMTPIPEDDVVITLPPTDVDDDPDPVVIIPSDPDDPVIYYPDPPADPPTPPAPPPWQLEYETDASGNVFYLDANGTKWTVAGETWGPGNPSDELADYLAETDHPWNAVIDPTMVSDATADAIDAIISDIVNTGDTVSDSPYYDIIGSDGDYTAYSFDTAFAVAREKHGGGGGTFTWNGETYSTDTKEEADTKSWSDADNWEKVIREDGTLDLEYTGDRDRPPNGDYTVPSLRAVDATGTSYDEFIAEGGSISIDRVVVGGSIEDPELRTVVTFTDKYGNSNTNADSLSDETASSYLDVQEYNNADNWRIDADNRGDPVLKYVGDRDLPPTNAFTLGEVDVPSLLDVDKAQDDQGIQGYLDLTEVDGEIKILDKYGNMFDTADGAASNEIQIMDRENPENYRIELEDGKPIAVYEGAYKDREIVQNATNETYADAGSNVMNIDLVTAAAVRGTMDPIGLDGTINEDMAYYLSQITGQDPATLVGETVGVRELGLLDAMGYTLTDDAAEYVVAMSPIVDPITLTEEQVEDPNLLDITVDSMRNLGLGFTSTFTGAIQGIEVLRGSNDQKVLDGYVEDMARLGGDRQDIQSRIDQINGQLEEIARTEGISLAEAREYRSDLVGQLVMLDQRMLGVETDIMRAQSAFEELVLEANIPLNERFFFELGTYLQENATDFIGEVDNPEVFTVKLFGALGNALGFATSAAGASIGATLATGNPVSGTIAGTSTAAVLGSLGNAASVYKEAVQSGASEDQARRVAQLGIVIGASEAIPIGKVLGNLPPNFADMFVGKIMKAAVDFAEEGAVEAAQEVMVSVLNDMAAKGVYDPDRQIFSSDLGEDALIGFLVGGITNAGLTAMTSTDLNKIANDTGISVEELKAAIENPVLFTDVAVDNKIDKATVDQLLQDGMNISQLVNDFKAITDGVSNPDGTTVEVLANQSAFGDTKVVDGSGNAAIVYGNPASNSFTATPTTDGSVGVFVNITNPFTIDGINNDTGFEKLVDIFGEDKANDIKDEYNDTGKVTITNEMVDTVVDNGYDGVINNDTGEVTVVDNSNVSTVTEEESATDETVVATRPEWKNEMDAMYNTYGGISIEEAQKIADQYGVPLTEFGDYYKEMVQVNQPWKQTILDEYLRTGRLDYDTLSTIIDEFDVTMGDVGQFYSKLSVASADGMDAGMLLTLEDEIADLGTQLEVVGGQLDTAQDAANWVNSQLDAGASRADIINTLKSEGAFTQTEAARLYDSINGFRETIGGLEGDIEGLEGDVVDLTKDRDFAEGAYQVVDSAWADGQDRQDIINNLLDNGFDNASAATLVDTVKQIRDTDTQLREERGFAQGGFDYVDGRLAEEATREEIFAELLDNGYTADTANLLLDNVINIFEQKAELVADASFAQGAYALVNSQLDNGKTKEEIVQLLADNNFPTDLAQGLVDSVQSYRDTITGLEGDVETEQGMTQFAQQAYDYINGQLDAETSLEDIVADLVDNGYTEAGANALVTNISDMRTNLAGVEAQLGTAQANQLFGQTAYSFVNEQLDIIANQDPDAETLLSESDIIQNLIDNGFSEANATTLVSNITTIRDTESGLREQISGLEAENTFVQGAYDLVTSRLETMSAQDPDAEVQITPESIVDELVAGGFDQTVAENLVNSVVGVRDQVNSLNMQLDSLGTQASFAQRAYTYVNTLLDQGKTSQEVTDLLIDNGFVADTAATLVTEVTNTRDTISGLEGSLETTQGQRTFAQRSFDFVNTQLDGDVDQADIITDLMDNGFSETDANNLVNDAVTIRDNTSLLEANNAFSQGAYGFIQEQLDAGTSTVDIIQEMIDNGFDYTTAQGFVTNVVNVRNEVDTLSDALGIMESRAEFAQTAFDYINGQLDNNVQEDTLLQDLVENYGFTANNAQSLVDSVQDTRFQQAERTRLETQLRSGVTFNFASAMQGQDDEDEPLVVDTDGDGVPDAPAVTTPSGPFTPVTERPDPYTFGTDDDTLPITEEEELDPGLGLLEFGPFGRPLGTYITQPTQPVGPFDAYAMQMPEEPIFDPQQARLGAQPTEVTLDEAGFVTEPVAYIPEEVPTDPTMYYSPQFNQFAQVPVGYGATTVPQSFIQQQLPAINEVTPQGIGAFLGRKPPEGVA